VYAKSLHIYDFKCFGKAELKFQYPGRKGKGASPLKNVNLVLGDNGGGKSSVLRALAIAVLAPALLESGFVPQRLVRRAASGQQPRSALLKVLALPDPVEADPVFLRRGTLELLARIDRRERGSLDKLHLESTPMTPVTAALHDDYSPAFFVVGYGATRRVETGDFSESSARRSRGLRYLRVAGLFEDHVPLRPIGALVNRLSRDATRMTEARELIDRVLPVSLRFKGVLDRDDGQVLFSFNDVDVPFSSLSDGYKAFVGMAGDIVANLVEVVPEGRRLDDQPGVVLIDEIDLHLHPSWQREVVPTLAAAFPKLQFILTSHSPLIAGTVHRQNIFVTDQDEKGLATIKQIDEKSFGRSVEQILLSSYFGLETTRPESFTEGSEALFSKAAAGDRSAALDYLRLLIRADAPTPTDDDEGEPA
jgi:hypothetical protein